MIRECSGLSFGAAKNLPEVGLKAQSWSVRRLYRAERVCLSMTSLCCSRSVECIFREGVVRSEFYSLQRDGRSGA